MQSFILSGNRTNLIIVGTISITDAAAVSVCEKLKKMIINNCVIG